MAAGSRSYFGSTTVNVANAMANPTLNLFQGSTLIAANDNWGDAASQEAIRDTGLAPPNAFESAILISLNPGSYTAIIRAVNNNTTGNALFEAYDLDNTAASKFGKIATTLAAANYTAIVTGVNNTTGNPLVEGYGFN